MFRLASIVTLRWPFAPDFIVDDFLTRKGKSHVPALEGRSTVYKYIYEIYRAICFYSNPGKSNKIDDTRRKYSVLTDKLHRIHNDYVLSMREGKEIQEGLASSMLPMHMSAQESYCQDSLSQWWV